MSIYKMDHVEEQQYVFPFYETSKVCCDDAAENGFFLLLFFNEGTYWIFQLCKDREMLFSLTYTRRRLNQHNGSNIALDSQGSLQLRET